jgi:hypothetical protein
VVTVTTEGFECVVVGFAFDQIDEFASLDGLGDFGYVEQDAVVDGDVLPDFPFTVFVGAVDGAVALAVGVVVVPAGFRVVP